MPSTPGTDAADHLDRSPQAPRPQLAKGAVIGLLWALACVLVALPAYFLLGSQAEVAATPSLGDRVFQALLFLSLAGVLGGPVVSAMACSRIRHSGGGLTGLGMATVGVWLVPVTFLALLVFVALLMLIDALTDNRELAQALYLLAGCLVLIVSVIVLARAARRAR